MLDLDRRAQDAFRAAYVVLALAAPELKLLLTTYFGGLGGNRDTAWYAMLDSEWPARKAAFEHWLAPENFDAEGCQRESLSALNAQGQAP